MINQVVYAVHLHEGCKHEGCYLVDSRLFTNLNTAIKFIEKYNITDKEVVIGGTYLISERMSDIQFLSLKVIEIDTETPEFKISEDKFDFKYYI